jgi:TonB family protein
MNKTLILASFILLVSVPALADDLRAQTPKEGQPLKPGEPDLTPANNAGEWAKDAQSKILSHWQPPPGEESKRLAVVFRVDTRGNLIDLHLAKVPYSGSKAADEAALKAVREAAPFKPFMSNGKLTPIDFQFTFDVNIFHLKQAKAEKKSP